MKLKITLYILLVISVLSLIAWIFWEQEYKYTLPTPVPSNFVNVNIGDQVTLPSLDLDESNTYIHFYNYDCPCSRFNIKEFQSMVRRYSDKVKFVAVLQTSEDDPNKVEHFKNKYDLGIKVIDDPKGKIASALGVYSTPQAVIVKNNKVFYKGNYNKARFCLSKNTKFAEKALEALINNQTLPIFPILAEIPYGCELPSNISKESSLFNLF